jgi:hypothetical protein
MQRLRLDLEKQQTAILESAASSSKGHLNYGNTGALGDPNEPGWAEKNLTVVSSPSGARFRVHKEAAAAFEGFLKDLEATGYKINPAESGGHSHRAMRGGTRLSEHAFGTAIDPHSSDETGFLSASGPVL